jgi:hypothetical protein
VQPENAAENTPVQAQNVVIHAENKMLSQLRPIF